MGIFDFFRKKEEAEPQFRRIEIRICDCGCGQMMYEGDEIKTFAGKKMHRKCFKELKKEAKRYFG